MPVAGSAAIAVVGASGQISLGKAYAGMSLRVERQADGSILLTPVPTAPESRLWTLMEPDRSRIARGLAWAARTPARETDIDQLLARGACRVVKTCPRRKSSGTRKRLR